MSACRCGSATMENSSRCWSCFSADEEALWAKRQSSGNDSTFSMLLLKIAVWPFLNIPAIAPAVLVALAIFWPLFSLFPSLKSTFIGFFPIVSVVLLVIPCWMLLRFVNAAIKEMPAGRNKRLFSILFYLYGISCYAGPGLYFYLSRRDGDSGTLEIICGIIFFLIGTGYFVKKMREDMY